MTAGYIQTIFNPEATAGEKFLALGFTFFRPAKGMNMAADTVKGIEKAADAADDVKDVGKAGKGAGEDSKPVELNQLSHLKWRGKANV